MENEITITRELANDIIRYFAIKDKIYQTEMDKSFARWGYNIPETIDEEIRLIAILPNSQIEELLLEIK